MLYLNCCIILLLYKNLASYHRGWFLLDSIWRFCFLLYYSNLPRNLDKRTTITIGDQETTVEASDLQKICDLGRGAYGIVEKMRHIPSGTIMAVKVSELMTVYAMCHIWPLVFTYFQRIAATVNTQEQKRLLMDLDISMRSSACPHTVQFYGALFMEGDVWICMEVMDTSLDKFYAKVYKFGRKIPEQILGPITVAVLNLLFLLTFTIIFDKR